MFESYLLNEYAKRLPVIEIEGAQALSDRRPMLTGLPGLEISIRQRPWIVPFPEENTISCPLDVQAHEYRNPG